MHPRARLASAALVVLFLGCSSNGATTAASGSTSATGGSTAASTSSTGSTGGMGGTGGANACPVCDPPASQGKLADSMLNEISGVVASLAHPGVYWVHNDSGDSARFFAVDAAGARLATFTVTGAGAIDWEDIARGPCPAGTCLYLADIGDNAEKRTSYTVYRVPEPATIADAAVDAERLDFTYPDAPHNAEALLVHPTTGAITIVTKVFVGASSIFEFPLPLTPGSPVVLTAAGKVQPPSGSVLVTGADVHPAGKSVLLRTYSDVWYYPMTAGISAAAALAGAPCALPVASEPQGEAVGFLADGKGYVTISEGVGAAVNQVKCPGL